MAENKKTTEPKTTTGRKHRPTHTSSPYQDGHPQNFLTFHDRVTEYFGDDHKYRPQKKDHEYMDVIDLLESSRQTELQISQDLDWHDLATTREKIPEMQNGTTTCSSMTLPHLPPSFYELKAKVQEKAIETTVDVAGRAGARLKAAVTRGARDAAYAIHGRGGGALALLKDVAESYLEGYERAVREKEREREDEEAAAAWRRGEMEREREREREREGKRGKRGWGGERELV